MNDTALKARLIVRPATVMDIPVVAHLMEEFTQETLADFGLSTDPAHCLESFKQYVSSSIVAVLDSMNGKIIGVLAGRIQESPMSRDKIYQEVVWFVSKQHRNGKCGVVMLAALEAMLQRIGVSSIVMGCMAGEKSQAKEKFYEAMGYQLLEKHFIKQIGAKK